MLKFLICLLISYFARNGFTVDDLGFLLAMAGVMTILFIIVIYRLAAVGLFHSKAPYLLTPSLQRLLVRMLIPIEYRNELIRRVSFVFLSKPSTLTDACTSYTQNRDGREV